MSLNKTAINWGYGKNFFTWNAITGCKRGCDYCYARRIHNRFHPDTPFSDIVYHIDRLGDPKREKKPSTIFVGSMSDIEYWPKENTKTIVNVCQLNPQHTFMFLSKNPVSYCDIEWPQNTMQGLTIEHMMTEKNKEAVAKICLFPRPFLSIEPLLGGIDDRIPDKIEKIIVGAQTGPGAVPVKRSWILSIKAYCNNDKIFWKNSIKEDALRAHL
jgi:protein gp37